ncbi:MAG: hypothetical protein ABSE73_29950 [Planctomycetota bacterium]
MVAEIVQLHRGGHMVAEIARRLGCTAAEAAQVIQTIEEPLVATPAPPAAKPWPKRRRRIPIIAWTPQVLRDLWHLPMGKFHAKYLIAWPDLKSKHQGLGVPRKPRGNFSKARFTDQMLALLGKRSDRQIARGFLLSKHIVKRKRRALGISSFMSGRSPWTPEYLTLLGKISDTELARKMGLSSSNVCRKRQELGIQLCRIYFKWTKRDAALLGKLPDLVIAERLGISIGQVMWKRQQLGIPLPQRRTAAGWTPEQTALVGRLTDLEAATQLGLSTSAVRNKRLRLGLPPARVKE